MDPFASMSWTALDAMIVGDALGGIAPPLQVTVFGLMLGCAAWAIRRPSVGSVVAFLACAAMWSRANQAFEGRILWTVSPGHGVCVADVWPVALAGMLVWRAGPRTHQRDR